MLIATLYNSMKLCKSTGYVEYKRKREEIVDVFRNGKFELLALMKKEFKGNGEVSWCGVNDIIASVHEMERGREGVAILLNDV